MATSPKEIVPEPSERAAMSAFPLCFSGSNVSATPGVASRHPDHLMYVRQSPTSREPAVGVVGREIVGRGGSRTRECARRLAEKIERDDSLAFVHELPWLCSSSTSRRRIDLDVGRPVMGRGKARSLVIKRRRQRRSRSGTFTE